MFWLWKGHDFKSWTELKVFLNVAYGERKFRFDWDNMLIMLTKSFYAIATFLKSKKKIFKWDFLAVYARTLRQRQTDRQTERAGECARCSRDVSFYFASKEKWKRKKRKPQVAFYIWSARQQQHWCNENDETKTEK